MHERVVVSGYYGYANPGDEAILTVLLGDLRRLWPRAAIAVISGTPAETAATHGVEAILWSDPEAIAEAVRGCDLVVTGGGGILHDYGGFQPFGLLTEGNWGIGFHVTAGLLAAIFGKPHVIYGVGAGPLFSAEAREHVRALCATASAITVRDEASAALLAEIGVPPERVEATADPAFLFEPAAAVLPEHAFRLTVAVRHWSQEAGVNEWEPELAAGLDLFAERHPDCEICFLPFQRFPGEKEDDLAVAQRVAARLRKPAKVLAEEYTPAQKAGILSASRLVFGMRLHAILFSVAARVRFAAIAYDTKVSEAVRRAGKAHLSVTISECRAGRVAELLERALDETPADPEPLLSLARRNGEMLARPHSPAAVSEEVRRLIATAILSLTASQMQLRHWLRDQKINYEFQIEQERKQFAGERQDLQAAQQQTEQEADELRSELETVRQQLGALEKVAQRQLQHIAEWEAHSAEVNAQLGVYRSQRAWRAMLASRKAYTLLLRQGWGGRLRFLPWVFSVLFGGGSLETEQLGFPARPKKLQDES